jgi:hypothetical protein
MKSRAHIYMASLLANEINSRNAVDLPGFGSIDVPQEVRDAIRDFPGAFYAGAVGPDFFPDMVLGQMAIHPDRSGDWLNRLYREYTRMPSNAPDKSKAFAFVLGITMHYACDMFTHHYINGKAGGWFETDKHAIVAKHILIETYIDNKVPTGICMEFDAPLNFLKDCFMSSDISYKQVLPGVKQPLDALRTLRSAIEEAATAFARADFASRFPIWLSEIDMVVINWLRACQQSAHCMTDPSHGLKDAVKPIKTWFQSDLPVALGLPRGLVSAYGYINSALDNLIGLKQLEDKFYDLVYQIVLEITEIISGVESVEQLRVILTDPARYINEGPLFNDPNYTKRLDLDLGNFGINSHASEQTFHPFFQCLNMGKLCLIGAESLNKKVLKSEIYKPMALPTGFRSGSVKIKTARRFLSGTDNTIYFAIITKDSKYEFVLDTPGHNDFEYGQTDTFPLRLPVTVDLASIKQFSLRKSEVFDDWSPEWLELYDVAGEKLYCYNFSSTLTGKGPWTWDVKLSGSEQSNANPIDPSIMAFLYSLDGKGLDDSNPNPLPPWEVLDGGNKFPIFEDAELRERVFNPLFITPATDPMRINLPALGLLLL